MLLLALSLAHAQTDIGTTKKFGLGIGTGPTTIALTGKYFFNEKSGLAFFAGTSFVSHQARVAYQSNIHSWGDNWSWGQLPLYWHVDVEGGLDAYPGYAGYPRLGVGGGVGVALQFKKVPIEVYADVGIGVYPVNGYCSAVAADAAALTGIDVSAGCWIGGMGGGGARWYF